MPICNKECLYTLNHASRKCQLYFLCITSFRTLLEDFPICIVHMCSSSQCMIVYGKFLLAENDEYHRTGYFH